jgi:DNA polymerase (family X)
VRDSAVAVSQLAEQGRLTELQGVGKTIAEKVTALLETGEIPAAAKLKSKFPATLVQIVRIPGVGPKTARKLYDELGIGSLDDLRAAAEQEQLRDVPGLGVKAEQNILAALVATAEDTRDGGRKRFLLSKALPLAERIVAELRAHPASESVELAGSARRMTETVKDIDVIATAHDPRALATALTELDVADASKRVGDAGARIVTHNGIAVELRVVAPEQFGNLLQHFTGSKQHNVALREYAVRRGKHVSEYGILDDETGATLTCATEQEVYAALELDYIEPELREGRGELDAARNHALPRLLVESDLRGDLHCHTVASDGRNTLEEMAKAAKQRGYSYLAITDHSASFGFGNDVQPDELRRQSEGIRELNEKTKGFKLLAGSEVNIDPDGSLDYDDDVLTELDWVIASVHSSFRMGEKKMTERVLAAMDHPLVDAIGHLTGRLILRRNPYHLDIERVFAHAAETGTMLEINSNPNRRDLSDVHARLAVEAGVTIVLNSDSHGTDTLDMVRYGVATARRAWLGPEQIANTRPLRDFRKLQKRPSFA